MKKVFDSVLIVIMLVLAARSETAQAMAAASAGDLWVDAQAGNNANSGASATAAFQTIQAAASIAGPGTTIHILPGTYRESIVPALDGSSTSPITYRAQNGPGTVIIRGSAPASSVTWTPLTSNSIGLPAGVNPAKIYFADLSGWGLTQAPRFIVQMDAQGQVASRLDPARAPNWQVGTWWKPTEFWWLANGGSSVAACDPITNSNHDCDLPSRSYTQLTDSLSDTDPAGVESGDLTTLGNLTGATLVAMDAHHAHYMYRATITAHDVASGRVTVDQRADNDGSPGLGWGSKYYVENHPALLDQPGEWWFDLQSGRLYLWAPNGGNPGQLNLEISRRDTGFDLSNRSYNALDGLTIELFNERAYTIVNSNSKYKAFGDSVRNCTLRYANQGVVIYQYMNSLTPSTYAIDNFLLADSDIGHMDTSGLDSSFWWPNAPSPDQFDHPGVRNAVFRNNHLHDLGFRSVDRLAVGARIEFADTLQFVGNTVDNTAHAGVHFLFSLINSTKQYGFSPAEIKLGDILVSGNDFDKTCVLASDCGALKFGGSQRPYTHVFKNVLITGNIFRNGIGWSYVSTLRGKTEIGDANGFYLDNASGVHVYRNIAYNNTGAGFKLSCLWRDGQALFYNNVVANNHMFGFKLTGVGSCDNHNGSVDTQLVDNILVNNDAFGMRVESAYNTGNFGKLVIDHNLYYQDGWDSQAAYGLPADVKVYQGTLSAKSFQGLAEIQAGTPWEDSGVEGDPSFAQYDSADHDRFDGSWPDFHLTAASANAIDRGSTGLPTSLSSLLSEFNIDDPQSGAAFDIGRFELAVNGPVFSASPLSRNFGLIKTATTSSAQVFSIRNTGGGTMTIGTVAVQGTNPGQFHITSNTCTGQSLPPDGTCSIAATFAPTSVGAKSAYLTVPDNAAGHPHHLSLDGKGATEQAQNGGLNTYPSATAKVPTYWTAINFGTADGKDTAIRQEGTASVRISNTSAVSKTLRQTRTISGLAGNAFKLSVWVRGDSIPTTSGSVQAKVSLYNGTTLVQTQTITFTSGTYGFTQKSLTFTASGAYTRVVVDLVYSKAGGTVRFDGLSLLKSP